MTTLDIQRGLAAALISIMASAAFAEPAPLPTPPATAAPPPARPTPPTQAATAPAQPASAPNAAPAPAPAVTTTVGPLELSPVGSTVKLLRIATSTCIAATLHFRMKNISASDVKVALLLTGFSAIDSTGESLLTTQYGLLRATGVTPIATVLNEGIANWVTANGSSMTILSPSQLVDVQIMPTNPTDWHGLVCTQDPNSEQFRAYHPTTYSLTGSLVLADLDGNAQVRPFSITDAPLQVAR